MTFEGGAASGNRSAGGAKWGGKCSSLLDCYLLAEGDDGFRGVCPCPRSIPACAIRW